MKQMQYPRRTLLKGCGASLMAGALSGCGALRLMPDTSTVTALPEPTPLPTASPAPAQPEALQSGQYRAIWISYLEWKAADFSSEAAFGAYLDTMFDRCAALGLNTVLVQVRPFADAFYKSSLFPWSHFITGTQGQDPGFDPLAMMIERAHARALSIEAWINPYRVRLNATMPEQLAESGLLTTKPDWVVAVGEGLYLNPALPEAADYVCQGVQEILDQYAVDGIHFDDYFYPTTEDYIDEAQFAASGAANRSAWRKENVSALVRKVYALVKAHDANLRFGISPQGNPENNEQQQFSDVSAWLNPAEGEECVDYICPQIYWGYGYTMQSGSQRFAFENITAEWLAMPRAASVALIIGLGAYRIGDGDGGQNENSKSQWNTGENLAAMIADINEMDAAGYALYRYDSLYASAYPDLAAEERVQIAAVNMANG